MCQTLFCNFFGMTLHTSHKRCCDPNLGIHASLGLREMKLLAQGSYILKYHWTCTGNLFLIWYYTCFNAILPNHPTLSLSHRVQKTVLYICVSFSRGLWPQSSLHHGPFPHLRLHSSPHSYLHTIPKSNPLTLPTPRVEGQQCCKGQ